MSQENIKCYNIDIGYYFNDHGNNFAYYHTEMDEVYIFDELTQDYQIEPCLIFQYKFTGSIYNSSFKNNPLIIICPERLKNDITIFSFGYCFIQFLYKNNCKYPVFTTLSFINELSESNSSLSNHFWWIKKNDFRHFQSCFKCTNCSRVQADNFHNCTNCISNKLYFPFIVFAAANKNCRIEEINLFNQACVHFLKALFIDWSSEIKSVISVGSSNPFGLIRENQNPFYRIILYLLEPNIQLMAPRSTPSSYDPNIFQLLFLLTYRNQKTYHYIFPALLYAYGPQIVYQHLQIILPNSFVCDIDLAARTDSEAILESKLRSTSFKSFFSDKSSNSLDRIEKAKELLVPFISSSFKEKYIQAVKTHVENAERYCEPVSTIFEQLKKFSQTLDDLIKNISKYDEKIITMYATSLVYFNEQVPDLPTKKHIVKRPIAILAHLTKIFFQKNIADYYNKEITISTAIQIFLDNFRKYEYPDQSFLQNHALIHHSSFESTFLNFIKQREKDFAEQMEGHLVRPGKKSSSNQSIPAISKSDSTEGLQSSKKPVSNESTGNANEPPSNAPRPEIMTEQPDESKPEEKSKKKKWYHKFFKH